MSTHSTEGRVRRPAWLREPFVLAGVTEGFVFAQRCGRGYIQDAPAPEYDWAQFKRLFSEPNIRRMAKAGVTVFLSFSFFRTFSTEAEAAERELTRAAVEICHRHGMRMAVYIADTLNPETLKAQYPDVESWTMRNAFGQPVLYADEWWRPRGCRINPKWKAFIKEHLRVAIQEFRVDMIHFDNFLWMSEPDRDCHCETCVSGFRRFLMERYGEAERRARFGFSDVRHVLPPRRLPGWGRPSRVRDPFHQDWLEFRCEGLASTFREFSEYVRGLNPKVVVELNPTGVTGANPARASGVDHDRLLRWSDVFWSEESSYAHVEPDGRLLSSIRSHKLARATGNKLLNYTSDPLRLAEAMAFGNGGLGCVGARPSKESERYIRFFHEHFRRVYASPASVARVALWRGSRALMLDSFDPHRCAVLTEQALIQGRRLFDLALDSHLSDLRRYRAVVVPCMHVFEDKNERWLRDYVAGGGGLVLLEQSGFLDYRLRRRRRPAFADELGLRGDYPAPPAERRWVEMDRGGRIAYLPEVRCLRHPKDVTDEEARNYGGAPKYWFMPDNADEILQAVRWAAREEPELEVLAPETVVVEAVRPRGGRCVAIHLINYQPQRPAGTIVVRMRPTLIARPRRVAILSPDRSRPVALPLQREDGAWSFTVHGHTRYDVALVEP